MGRRVAALGRAWRDLCGRAPAAPAIAAAAPFAPYVCFQYHQVHVVWSRHVETPTVVDRLVRGLEAGQQTEECHHVLWPHERFARDDIDNHEVQSGYLRHQVGPVWRRYLPLDGCALVYGHGLTRISTAAAIPDGFFVGFAPSLVAAMRWVATGEADLFIPWSTPT